DVAGAPAPPPQVYGGWAGAPVQAAAPRMQQVYSAAQTQLALRRDLAPAAAPRVSDTVRMRGAYSTAQVMDGLRALQQDYAETASGTLLDLDTLKRHIEQALIEDGAPQKLVEGEAVDAIEVVASLFNALLHDALVAEDAKSHLTRLQPSVHRAALMDEDFFQSDDHPVRQVINRLSRLRDGSGEGFTQRHEQVGELITRVNRDFQDDVGVFEGAIAELDGILESQEAEYRERVAGVVESCEEQQRVLEERRGRSLDETDGTGGGSDLPEEWNKWLERSRKLEVGQRVIMNANSSRAAVVTLVWKEARDQLFVFVDEQGNKASTLTLQQVAMNLRRGVIEVIDDAATEAALERAMVGVVEGFHSQVEAQATRDALTGFLLGRFFGEAIDAALPDAETRAARDTAVCHLSIENLRAVNDAHGAAVGDALLKGVAETLERIVRGKNLVFGRLEGGVLGIYWPHGGIKSAYKKMQGVMDALAELSIDPASVIDDEAQTVDVEAQTANAETVDFNAAEDAAADAAAPAVAPEVVAGLSGSGESVVDAEGLLAAAREACDSARESGPGSIYIAGTENEQPRRLEQLISYADRALERDCLVLSGQHVTSLTETELPPSLVVAVGAADRNGKAIPPHLFGPAAARSASAGGIDLWVFRRTLAWVVDNEDEADRYALIVVPLSPASVKNEDLPNLLMGEFMETPVPPGRICFSLPDNDVVENLTEVSELISVLREFGCRFMLDEFGSGHANYDYIKSIDIDFVTVKSGFVSDAKKDPKDFAMAKSINELVHFMGKKTVAKQAAGEDLAETMVEIGIDFLLDQTERASLQSPEGAE
ncbi:MAG: DUF1631 family protein, partial [Gammaproteobacteria bacterium]